MAWLVRGSTPLSSANYTRKNLLESNLSSAAGARLLTEAHREVSGSMPVLSFIQVEVVVVDAVFCGL